MKTLLRKMTWLHGIDHGWGCGYVLLPKGHPYHGVDYDDIPVSVHGGLTYGEEVTDRHLEWGLSPEDTGCWMVGFDTAHAGDTSSSCPRSYVETETESLREQLEALNTAEI